MFVMRNQKLEEGLLEDLWRLLRAGRLEEGRQLCRNAGQVRSICFDVFFSVVADA